MRCCVLHRGPAKRKKNKHNFFNKEKQKKAFHTFAGVLRMKLNL
jgi:hypothetical protein